MPPKRALERADPEAEALRAKKGPGAQALVSAAMMQEQRDLGKQAFDSPALMAVVEMERDKIEAQCMALELERLAAVSGGGRRGSKRGGGEIANKAFNWLWGKISGAAVAVGGPVASAAVSSNTAAALKEVLDAAKTVPSESVKGVDAAIAASIRTAVPVVKGLAAAAPAATAFVGMSYAYSHPSIAVGIADCATRFAAIIVDKVGGLGPSWGTAYKELISSATIIKGATINAASIVADRPYLATAIAWVLLEQYAKSKGKSASALLKETGDDLAKKALGLASGAAASAAEFGKDFADVAAFQWNDFILWLERRPELGAKDARAQLGELKAKFGAAIEERAKANAAVAKEEEQKASAKAPQRPASGSVAEDDVAPMSSQKPTEDPGEGMEWGQKGDGSGEWVKRPKSGGRRLTSRRRRRAAYLPRQTRRSSSGRRRGYSRRRRE